MKQNEDSKRLDLALRLITRRIRNRLKSLLEKLMYFASAIVQDNVSGLGSIPCVSLSAWRPRAFRCYIAGLARCLGAFYALHNWLKQLLAVSSRSGFPW